MSTWYSYYQMEPESKWITIVADQKAQIVKEKKPPFTSVLELDYPVVKDTPPDILHKVCYRGPFYIDLDDKEDTQFVIDQFKKLLTMLRDEYEVRLEQIELFATGGKGFHLVFKPEMFCKPGPRGVPGLPLVYREMAKELTVDTMDMRVYSARSGRMWREPNVKRTNGRFKVQITVEEAFDMTVESYVALTSAKRYGAHAEPPTLNSALAVLYSASATKLTAALAASKKNRNSVDLLKQFEGQIPPTLSGLMNGENVNHAAGFQKIATQLAIAATAMSGGDHENRMTRDKFITACEGLINNHVGDGSRYDTPQKRKRELERMWDYMHDNPGYSYSLAGIKAITEKGTSTKDLELGTSAVNEEGEIKDGIENDITEKMAYSISLGLKVNASGIYKKSDEGGYTQVSALGLTNPRQLIDLNTGEVHGYQVDVHIDGKPYGKPRHIGMDAFASRNAFMKFTLGTSCSVGLTDAQIGAIADIMRKQTEENGQQVFTIRREGIDVINLPGGITDIVWADQYAVSSNHGANYRLSGSMTEDLQFRTDLRHAPTLIDTDTTRQFFDSMFQINTRDAIGRMFGWYLAAFMCQPIRHLFTKFPSLQVYGPAGSGKSETSRFFARLHYHKTEPNVTSALDSTRFVFEEMATCSGSIPYILDEFKPREMRKDLLEKIKGILRSNYNGDGIGKGSVSSSTGAGKLILTRVANRSPITVISEAQITQTATMERAVMVPLTKEGRGGNRDQFEYCREHREVLSALGRMAIDAARATDLDGLREQINANVELVRMMVGSRADDSDRQVFNIAIILTGLEFGRQLMERVFGERYNATFKSLVEAVASQTDTIIPKVMSEANKVLDTLAFLSRHEPDERFRLIHGEDYLHYDTHVEVRMRNVHAKYARYKKNQGEEVLYDSYEAFYAAMSNYSGTLDTKCIGSILKDTAQTAVFKMSVLYMCKEGVEEFKKP